MHTVNRHVATVFSGDTMFYLFFTEIYQAKYIPTALICSKQIALRKGTAAQSKLLLNEFGSKGPGPP